jgi:hypothetical protein
LAGVDFTGGGIGGKLPIKGAETGAACEILSMGGVNNEMTVFSGSFEIRAGTKGLRIVGFEGMLLSGLTGSAASSRLSIGGGVRDSDGGASAKSRILSSRFWSGGGWPKKTALASAPPTFSLTATLADVLLYMTVPL